MSYESWLAMKEKRAQKYLSALVQMLEVEKLEFVTVTYSGGGDCGQFEFESLKRVQDPKVYQDREGEKELSCEVDTQTFTSRFDNETNKWAETFETQKCTLAEWFIDAAHHAVSMWHSGWENNEGGFGTVRFDRTGVTVAHSDYVLVTEDSTNKLELSDLTLPADKSD